MEIKISAEELKKRSLLVGVPIYSGAHGLFLKSCLELQNLFNQLGIQLGFTLQTGESLVQRARNYLADEFTRSDFTHFMFIDSDIEFNAKDILSLFVLDRDVIGGPYPKKQLMWNKIRHAITAHPEISNDEAEACATDFVWSPATEFVDIGQPMSVMEIGTGHMMVKRHVFEKLRAAYPEQIYRPDHIGTKNFGGEREICAYFDCKIVNGRYLSEDYWFCYSWRKIGGEVFLCPWMKLTHHGTYAFRGNFIASTLCNEEILTKQMMEMQNIQSRGPAGIQEVQQVAADEASQAA